MEVYGHQQSIPFAFSYNKFWRFAVDQHPIAQLGFHIDQGWVGRRQGLDTAPNTKRRNERLLTLVLTLDHHFGSWCNWGDDCDVLFVAGWLLRLFSQLRRLLILFLRVDHRVNPVVHFYCSKWGSISFSSSFLFFVQSGKLLVFSVWLSVWQ